MRKLTVDSDIVADYFFSFNFGIWLTVNNKRNREWETRKIMALCHSTEQQQRNRISRRKMIASHWLAFIQWNTHVWETRHRGAVSAISFVLYKPIKFSYILLKSEILEYTLPQLPGVYIAEGMYHCNGVYCLFKPRRGGRKSLIRTKSSLCVNEKIWEGE